MNVVTLLNAAAATGAGSTVEPALDPDEQYQNLPVQVTGTFVGTVAVEVSLDGVTWYAFTSKTAVEAFTIPFFPFVRGNVTAFTSGAITVKLGY